ncbi:HEAT repeat domain-containing protein [Desulfomarina sp.]
MKQKELQENGVMALRAFNNALVTARLYPPTAPQVTNAVDIGYKKIREFLRNFGTLDIMLKEEVPFLCGLPLDEEILSSFSNLVVYRQMVLLTVSRLSLAPSMDRFAFSQILSVFNAGKDKIMQAGGGIEYITSLGLAGYFPEPVEEEAGEPDESLVQSRGKKVLKVDAELLSALLGNKRHPAAAERLAESFSDMERGVEILVAATGHILKELKKKKGVGRTALFPRLLQDVQNLFDRDSLDDAAHRLAVILTENLREATLCVLLSQEYPEGFGESFYRALLKCMSVESFGRVISLFRGQVARLQHRQGDASSALVEKMLEQLLATEKGRQYLATEKAKEIIEKGEEERKKRRVEAGIERLLAGNTASLKSVEVLEALPGVIRELKARNDSDHLEQVVEFLAEEIRISGGPKLLSSAVAAVEILLVDGHCRFSEHLLRALLAWVKKTENSDEPFERVVLLLELVMQQCWKDGRESLGDEILTFFHEVRTEKIVKSEKIRSIVANIQDRNIRRSSLPELLNTCLFNPENKEAGYRLVFQGPVALQFLVESLIMSQNAEHRFKIIDLLTYDSRFVPEIVHGRLQEHMPWYGKRNLVKLLAETGGEEDAESVLTYLNHEDFRVQREALICLYKIGGEKRKKLLLTALDDSSELIKVQIIKVLGRFCDAEVAGQLAELLNSFELFSEKNRNALLLQILDTLGRCSSTVALKSVRNFVSVFKRRSGRKLSSQVKNEAEKVLRFLEKDQEMFKKKHIQATQLRKKAIRQTVWKKGLPPGLNIITGLQEEAAIRSLLDQGESETARKKLVEFIRHMARMKKFVQAEKLRDWLIEIDSTALTDIIAAAEIIAEEKAAAIDREHLEIWSDLYDFLTTEEFSEFYHSLHHKKIRNEEVIVHQGTLQNALYFINSGKVKLYYDDGEDRVLLKTLGAGEIIGAGAFFDASVWTISVVSVGMSEISILKFEKTTRWQDEYPALESRLRDFCSRFESTADVVRKSSHDRRQHERYMLSGRAEVLLLDSRGMSSGIRVRGELIDISAGGISYLQRISKKKNARLILGRKVRVTLSFEPEPSGNVVLEGDILAAKEVPGPESDFSVHVCFDTELDSVHIQKIIEQSGQESEIVE